MSGTNDAPGVTADTLIDFAARLLETVGVPKELARITAEDLVSADLENIPSHGVMLLPMYVARLKAGSVSLDRRGEIVSDRGSALIMDAQNGLGQPVARRAVDMVAERAKETGLAALAIRNAFHFGAAGLYARMIAERGLIGIVMSNTRPLMPAPGGAEPMVGNNPLAIAVPSTAAHPVETDMAMSASAMGRIRLAAARGEAIPKGWAADKSGQDTTDPAAAIAGMLLPAAGPKGFGLAFMIDLLCGGLSGGKHGAGVRPLYGNETEPYACSQFYLAIDPDHFVGRQTFSEAVGEEAARVSASKPAPGATRVFAPGELTATARETNGGICRLEAATRKSLAAAAAEAGLDASFLNL